MQVQVLHNVDEVVWSDLFWQPNDPIMNGCNDGNEASEDGGRTYAV